jgi:hypothetical protein
MRIEKTNALLSLVPTAEWHLKGDGTLDWLDKSITQPTDSAIDEEVTRLTSLESMRLLRVERNRLLAATDWRASSDLTLTDAWKTYRQSLRDLPASSTPTLDSDGNLDMSSVTFPTEPS